MEEQERRTLAALVEENFTEFVGTAQRYMDKDACKALVAKLELDPGDVEEYWEEN